MLARYYSLIILLTLSTVISAQYKQPNVEKPASWVTVKTLSYGLSHLDNEAEYGYIDLDYERQVSVADQSEYIRSVMKITTHAGIENASEISVSYDPSYSQLTFHNIVIIRDGKKIDKLSSAKFKMLQQEEELDRHLYNGKVYAMLALSDVRKDDIIEYAYTIKGFNPIFKGIYCDVFSAGFSRPVYNVYYKVIIPDNRPLQVQNIGGLEPLKSLTEKGMVYEWNMNNIYPTDVEDKIPTWFNPYNAITVAEYNNWQQVDQWASELFPVNVSLSAAVLQKIKQINGLHTNIEEKVLAVLRFVQDEIRYTGIEIGQHSHKPHHPNKVFAQRFGDCKDKSYLFCSMLRSMGIEAYPVLTNTSAKAEILEWLPSHFAFDHVTTRVTVNGQYYWFDPTITQQRGRLENISYPDYGYGLVVTGNSRVIAEIKRQNHGEVKIRELFEIQTMKGETVFTVTTTYSGSYADNLRYSFTSKSLGEHKKKFREFYSYYFEDIEIDSVSYTDDSTTGNFIVYEYYSIPNVWKTEGEKDEALFFPFVISSVLSKPKDINRKMPVGLSYPAKYTEEIEISLPEDWNVKPAEKFMSNPAFTLKYNFYDLDSRRVKLYYFYETHKDHVPVEDTRRYFEDYNEISDELAFSMTKNSRSSSISSSDAAASIGNASGWPSALKTVFVILLVSGLVVMGIRMKS
jgi:transglutaminase-like putative cysteine protease